MLHREFKQIFSVRCKYVDREIFLEGGFGFQSVYDCCITCCIFVLQDTLVLDAYFCFGNFLPGGQFYGDL